MITLGLVLRHSIEKLSMSPNREKLQKKNYIEKIYPTRITVKYLAINVEGFFFFTSCCILASTWKTASFGTGSSASRYEIFRYSTFQLYSIHLYSHLFVEVNLEKKWSS